MSWDMKKRDKELEVLPEKLKPLKRQGLKPAPKVEKALVVLLDVSGSMADRISFGETKLQVAWKSFKQVLQKHLAGWHLGILLFGTYEGDGVQWHLPPTSTVELDALREPEAQDETPMLPALRMAWEWLRRRAEGGRIILLTDGLPNRGGYQEEILDEAPKHSVPIDCIGFKSMDFAGYDKDFLRKLSSATGGIFTEAERAEELLAGVLRLSPAERPLLGKPK